MSKREEEKRKALEALARIARQSTSPPPSPRPSPQPQRPPPSAPRPSPSSSSSSSSPSRSPSPPSVADARARERRLQERQEKLAEEKALKDRRANELAGSAHLQWRGMDRMGVPASIRRTGFDREEPSVAQKIHDVLGDVREKEGRAKHRDKGRRQG